MPIRRVFPFGNSIAVKNLWSKLYSVRPSDAVHLKCDASLHESQWVLLNKLGRKRPAGNRKCAMYSANASYAMNVSAAAPSNKF